jgi:LmbE family N-acetylglucosaminyl deacetylase
LAVSVRTRLRALIHVAALAWISAANAAPALPAMASPGARDRVIIIAPHPDDESLCCAGLIRRTLSAGGSVAIVWFTSGDAFELDAMVVERTLRPRPAGLEKLALIRMREARSAAARLGVPSANLFFLGYPDRGVRQLLLDRYDSIYRSKYTGADHVPYDGTVAKGSAYTGRNLERDLNTVMTAFKPTLIAAPSPEDVHPDHRATGELAIRVLGRLNLLASVRYWIVHGGEGWPSPRGLHRELHQTPPPVAPLLPWQRLTLTSSEQEFKLAALQQHRSQMKVMAKMMVAFVRQDELFSPEPLAD